MITIAKIQQIEADLDRGQLTFHACLVRDMLDEIRRLAAMVDLCGHNRALLDLPHKGEEA